jgi:Flp pilus assembly pilin Flp
MKQAFCKHGAAARRSTAPRRRGKVTEVPKLVVRALSRKAQPDADEQGQTFAEYAVALSAISLGVLAALIAFSGAVKAAFDAVNATVSGILS